MILQSNDRFDEMAQFDPATGNYRLLSRKANRELVAGPITGSYSLVGQTLLALYRQNGDLFVWIGDRTFPVADTVSSTLTVEGAQKVFRLLDNERLIAILKYSPPVRDVPIELDPTPFVEEEDFDFVLFLHHVLTEPGRRKRVYTDQ